MQNLVKLKMKKIKINDQKGKKKAQLKIQEMSFMLMAVVLFFILAFLFFITIKYRQMYKEASLLEQEKTLSTVSKLSDTAEFTCGKPLCIDTDKIIIMQDRKEYDGFFPLTSLSIVKIFPSENKTLRECNQNNYPDCNLFKIYDKQVKSGNEETLSTFVTLCRKEIKNNYLYDKCELGKMAAGFEPKQAGK